MKVRASAEVAEFIGAHGDPLYVWTEPHRFFMSAFTILRTATDPPDHLRSGSVPVFRPIRCESFDLLVAYGSRPPPDELILDLRGRFRPHVEAYWNGRAFLEP